MLLSQRFRIHRQILNRIIVRVRAQTRLACTATLLAPNFFPGLDDTLLWYMFYEGLSLLLVRKVRGHKTFTAIFQHVWTYLSSNKHFPHL